MCASKIGKHFKLHQQHALEKAQHGVMHTVSDL